MKYFLSLLLLSCLCSNVFAQNTRQGQNSIISTKKVLLNFQGQKDSLIIPVVLNMYPALKEALSERNLFFGNPVDSVVKAYNTEGRGITSFDYEVVFENKEILSIKLNYETMGAYPTSYSEWFTYAIDSGKPYDIGYEINRKGLNWIYSTYKNRLIKYIGTDKARWTKNSETKEIYAELDVYHDLKASVDTLTFKEMFRRYLFANKGIYFSTEDVLPHVVRNMEVGRQWFIPYAKLKSYAKPNSIVLKHD